MAKAETFNLEDFGDTYPDVMRWIMDSHATFDFALSLKRQIEQRGTLSLNQIAAARRCASRVRPDTSTAPAVDTTKLERVFAQANTNLKKPALNVGAFRFSPAPVTGKNPGAIYVKHEGQYLGKMLGGKFLANCTAEAMEQVLGIAGDPLGKAIEHGKLTGRCAICNRNLKDEDSVGRGIGPVCAEKFGWGMQ